MSKWQDRSSWVFFGMGVSFHLCCKGILQNYVYLSLELSPKNFGLRKFFHSKCIGLSTPLIHGRACWPHLTTVDVFWRLLDVQSLLLHFLGNLLYNLFLQLYISWQDCNRQCIMLFVCCSKAFCFFIEPFAALLQYFDLIAERVWETDFRPYFLYIVTHYFNCFTYLLLILFSGISGFLRASHFVHNILCV